MSLEGKILPPLCSYGLVDHFAKMILCAVVLYGLETYKLVSTSHIL